MKQQVLIIHGGETFAFYDDYLNYLKNYKIDFEKIFGKSQRWKRTLSEDLGDKFEVIQPLMPCPRNAKYIEWKIWVEKYFPYLQKEIILIGHSLGGIFWVKYLSENKFPKKIKQLHLVAPPFNHKELVDFNFCSKKLFKIERQTEQIFLYHSQDDPVVPLSDFEKYAKQLPTAKKIVFQNKGHFLMEHFPEIVRNIKK
ncbi:MAG TPA: hypothetical protein ENL06_03900 [Candidatus Portnoybacteria bacterium]|nr:hypothetical protein [Candidatus Portnoybacteria bacterium]